MTSGKVPSTAERVPGPSAAGGAMPARHTTAWWTGTAGMSGPGPQEAPARHLVTARFVGWILLGAQFVVILAFSIYQYHRFALTLDFGFSAQAWSSIAHGHLNPWSSLLDTEYWRNNAEFVMWPLALLHHVWGSTMVLLVIQDLAVVLAELVAFHWVLELLTRSSRRLPRSTERLLVIGVAAVLVLDPWCYETVAFDFHTETLAALFLVLAGRALWAGRFRRLLWWVPLTLVCTAPASLYLVGLGVSGIVAGRRTRVAGLLVGVTGLGWFLLMSALSAVGLSGRAVEGVYAYLTGPRTAHVGILSVLWGALHHPAAVAALIGHRWLTVLTFLVVMGLVGAASPWGFGVTVAVFAPITLASSDLFLRLPASFQVWPALPFVLVGTVTILVALFSGWHISKRLGFAVVGIWAAVLVPLAARALPEVPAAWVKVSPGASATLSRVQQMIPGDAEVIASGGIVGRFAERDWIYNYPFDYRPRGTSYTAYPVVRPTIVLILAPDVGLHEAAPSEERAAVVYVRHTLHARPLLAGHGIYAFEWAPPSGVKALTLP